MLTVYRTWPREERQEEDIRAVDRGEVVTVFCAYRGTYGTYPRRFMGCWLDLTSRGLVIRPMLFFGFLWRRIPVPESITEARAALSRASRRLLTGEGPGRMPRAARWNRQEMR
jgi:hypothetical protein